MSYFAVGKSAGIIDKLLSNGNLPLIDMKTELCLFIFQNFQAYDIDTIKYSNICEIFVKKLRKYKDEKSLLEMKLRIKEKVNDNYLLHHFIQTTHWSLTSQKLCSVLLGTKQHA